MFVVWLRQVAVRLCSCFVLEQNDLVMLELQLLPVYCSKGDITDVFSDETVCVEYGLWFFRINMACDCSQALNEVVVDRGDASYLCQLDLYIEDKQVTVVQGDGWYF